MQVDELYPEQSRRNYKSFVDGLIRVSEEGALFRGALANGLKLAGLVAVSTGVYDWLKENTYYFTGPISLVRILATAGGVATAGLLSMPFDTVRTRLHTMRPLPNGQMPYDNTFDCFMKIVKYECSFKKQSNYAAFYSGGQAYFARLFAIAMISQYVLDWYLVADKQDEFWQPARFHYSSGIDYDIHNPYTDGFNQSMIRNWMAKGGFSALHPDGISNITVL